MKTVIISAIGISSLFFMVALQRNTNERTWQQEQLEKALAVSMSQTLKEVAVGESYGISDQNEMMAAFLQSMLRKLDREVDLTVKVHRINYAMRQMDIEAIGIYRTTDGREHKVSVRRNVRIAAPLS